jgi:hypothetical protein
MEGYELGSLVVVVSVQVRIYTHISRVLLLQTHIVDALNLNA